MKKVRLRNAEYMATLPPYRFAPGDVIEIDDAWAEQIVQRGIATKASPNAETVQEKRAAMRDEQEIANWEASAADRMTRRLKLQAELDALDQIDAAPEGHYSDAVTRGEPQSPPDDLTVLGSAPKAAAPAKR